MQGSQALYTDSRHNDNVDSPSRWTFCTGRGGSVLSDALNRDGHCDEHLQEAWYRFSLLSSELVFPALGVYDGLVLQRHRDLAVRYIVSRVAEPYWSPLRRPEDFTNKQITRTEMAASSQLLHIEKYALYLIL